LALCRRLAPGPYRSGQRRSGGPLRGRIYDSSGAARRLDQNQRSRIYAFPAYQTWLPAFVGVKQINGDCPLIHSCLHRLSTCDTRVEPGRECCGGEITDCGRHSDDNWHSGDHFYTTSVAERDNAVAKHGYLDEGVACHVFPAASAGTTPLLRAFSPASGVHLYTTSVAERDNAVAKYGYVDEGVACYVYSRANDQLTSGSCRAVWSCCRMYLTDPLPVPGRRR
jgi:hypothetical protein